MELSNKINSPKKSEQKVKPQNTGNLAKRVDENGSEKTLDHKTAISDKEVHLMSGPIASLSLNKMLREGSDAYYPGAMLKSAIEELKSVKDEEQYKDVFSNAMQKAFVGIYLYKNFVFKHLKKDHESFYLEGMENFIKEINRIFYKGKKIII